MPTTLHHFPSSSTSVIHSLHKTKAACLPPHYSPHPPPRPHLMYSTWGLLTRVEARFLSSAVRWMKLRRAGLSGRLQVGSEEAAYQYSEDNGISRPLMVLDHNMLE